MAIALHHSRAKGTAKLVLLGIANHVSDGGSWPSMATLGKYGNCTADQARKLVRKLEALGEVRTGAQAGGLASTPEHMRPNLYEFRLRCPSDCDGTMNHRSRSVLFPQDLSTPPANSLPPKRPYTPTPYPGVRPNRTTNPPVDKSVVVPNRGRASAAHQDRTGRACPGEMIDDRHCVFGCVVDAEGQASA